MPCILSLAASGSPHRCGRRATHLAARLHSLPTAAPLASSFATTAYAHLQHRSWLPTCTHCLPSPARRSPWSPRHGPVLRHLNALQAISRHFAATSKPVPDAESTLSQGIRNVVEDADQFPPFRPQLSRNARKASRRSRPADVLASIHGPAKDLYWEHPSGSSTSFYAAHQSQAEQLDPRSLAAARTLQLSEPNSLHSVLERYLKHRTSFPPAKPGFQFTASELHTLRSRGYRPDSVERWAACLIEPKCNVAASIFEQQSEGPPLFLLLLFLRRKHIRVYALGIIMRHLDRFTQVGILQWSQLKIIAVRLLRHVREIWPESIPWITSFLVAQSSRLRDKANQSDLLSSQMLSDMTRFYNSYLVLICLPTSLRPLVCAAYQERAQFQLLKYMASTSPPIVVSRPGFRAVARNQLAHTKTAQERDWAELKGASWPPWKENRTAMDEDKGYKFGASRASKLLHRMYEAGYTHRTFEDMVQIYAGWDTDHSPTIQTRTTLPHFSSQFDNDRHIRPLLWAGRIRTTRTQREAWACFLSQELSGEAAHSEIYLAMFEKLHYSAVQRTSNSAHSSDPDCAFEEDSTHLLPGDMKEILPDPLSSLHYVYLSEPVPQPSELLERMRTTHIKPSRRLLAFLLETYPDFQTCLDLLHMNRHDFNGGIGHILYGIHDENDASIHSIDGHLFKAIIRFLCRFGRFDRPPPRNLTVLDPKEHAQQIQTNRHYLVEYAHRLLVRYRPRHRVAWTTFINKLLHQKKLPQSVQVERYGLVCDLLDRMEHADLDVDDDTFGSACVATTYATQSVGQDTITVQDERLLFSTGSSRIRTLFNNLVGATAEMHSRPEHLASDTISPHVPGPAELHAYVRALGTLGDYEGLYSFTTWLAKHRPEVSVRAQAQRGGMDVLFRTLVALRLAISGGGLEMGIKHATNAPEDIALLIRKQIESIEEWGGWPTEDHVKMYIRKQLRMPTPSAGGR